MPNGGINWRISHSRAIALKKKSVDVSLNELLTFTHKKRVRI